MSIEKVHHTNLATAFKTGDVLSLQCHCPTSRTYQPNAMLPADLWQSNRFPQCCTIPVNVSKKPPYHTGEQQPRLCARSRNWPEAYCIATQAFLGPTRPLANGVTEVHLPFGQRDRLGGE